MTESPNFRLRRFLDEYLAGALETEQFCSQFEQAYNMELDKETMTRAEADAFNPLFEEVVWYSPFPEEREAIPNYRGDDEIRKAATLAAHRLRE